MLNFARRGAVGLSLAAVFAFGFVALTPQPSRADDACDAGLQPVNDLLQKAESALGSEDTATAASAYDSAMTQLANAPWTPPLSSCDANRYRYEKLLATARSLVVAIKLNRIEPKAARDIDAAVLGQIYSLTGARGSKSAPGTTDVTVSDGSAPGSTTVDVTRGSSSSLAAAQYFQAHYRDLYDRYGAYYTQTSDIEQQRLVALHNPVSASCSNPNVAAEPLAQEMTGIAMLLGPGHRRLSSGTYTTAIDVHLTADGKVEAATMDHSSGNHDFDDAVLQDAQKTTYLPAVANCKQVPSVYVFSTTEKIGY
jgi:TonB family protein